MNKLPHGQNMDTNNKKHKKILIDLDGVLNKYGKEPYDENNIPEIRDGAEEFIKELSDYAELYLFTSRNIMLSVKWLFDNKIDSYFKDVTNVKIPSYLYIDDRCICFRGKYEQTLKNIKTFKVYWE